VEVATTRGCAGAPVPRGLHAMQLSFTMSSCVQGSRLLVLAWSQVSVLPDPCSACCWLEDPHHTVSVDA
jgi:hypothetical protein